MNKLMLALALALPSALANAADTRPYVGLDVSRLTGKFRDSDDDILKDKYAAFTLDFGTKFTQYFGAELFYKKTLKETTKDLVLFVPPSTIIPVEAETSFSGFGLMANGYVPLTDRLNFEPAFGLGMYKGKITICDALGYGICESGSDDGTLGVTFGVGLGYEASEHVGLRGGFKYTTFSDDDFSLKDFTEIYLGAKYVF
jgi:opacity protein-like surface antigen